jgi:3-dehydroquinate synthase
MTVSHAQGQYDVFFRPFRDALEALPDGVAVVTDQNVFGIYRQELGERRCVVVPAGEASKSLETYADVQSRLARLGLKRTDTVMALGGGVIGDLAGFVAATYMRSVQLIQIPTSLLAQVDSSVGGKVGVDLPEGKNLVGAFKSPDRVEVDVRFLRTLPSREFRNGMAEVCKYGFIMDVPMVEQLGAQPPTLAWEGMEDLVRTCIAHKAAVVQADEFELNGVRATLNFGHTVGHAIEQVFGYSEILHGEAISIGMVVESRLAERLGIADKGVAEEVSRVLAGQGLPVNMPPGLSGAKLLEAMRRDKKAGATLAFSLVPTLGTCKLHRDVPEDAVLSVLESA